MYTLALGVLGTANPKPELIDQALDDWISALLPSDGDVLVHPWLPADRVHTTPGVAAVYEWLRSDEIRLACVASERPGVRGRPITDAASTVVNAEADQIVSELLSNIATTTADGDCDPWLLLLWEEGNDDEAMEDIARQAVEHGIKVVALSSTGTDEIVFDDEEQEEQVVEEQDETEMPEIASAAKISEEYSPSPAPEDSQPAVEAPEAADEAQALMQPALPYQKMIADLAADTIVAFYRMVDAVAKERVQKELAHREPVSPVAERGEEATEHPLPGKPRATADMVTVIAKADGTYAPLKPGRLPAGASKVQISRDEARTINLA